ncbi:MAG: tetratricopeptide repeat protein, partial [Thermodesulfobacteriota bacterium]
YSEAASVSFFGKEIETILELDPDHPYGLAIQGTLFTYLPGIIGGDLKLGEIYLRMSVRQDPHTSSTKIYLGRNLMKQKKYVEAIKVFKEIIDEKNPKVYADWYLNRKWARYWMRKSIKRMNEQIRSNKN